MLEKLNKLTSRQAAAIIAIVGLAVYSIGLINPFMGDDEEQIVSNIPVHSISIPHLITFFNGGTFYSGSMTKLGGIYYRPLMTTMYSIVYTLFGPHPFYFHLLQLLLGIGSSILLYLFFRHMFKPALAIVLALVFLIHPINSQTIYYIAALQDALYFFFGILALWVLVHYNSIKSLWLVSLCLFLSLLSKETGIFFVAMALLCLFWWDRKRFRLLAAIITAPVVLWLALKIHAVGLSKHSAGAPIDNLSTIQRLFTAPSIILLFFEKFIFPLKLASGYWWVYPTFSITHVFIPLVIDLVIVFVAIYLAILLKRRCSRSVYLLYVYFGIWTSFGLLAHSQIIALDFTATEPWFYFSVAGLLGMIGVVTANLVSASQFKKYRSIAWTLIIILLLIFGFRTAMRGLDYRNQYKLGQQDMVAAATDNFYADDIVALHYYTTGDYSPAINLARQAFAVFPNANSDKIIGDSLCEQGNYEGALNAYVDGLKYHKGYYIFDEDLAQLTVDGTGSTNNQKYLLSVVHVLPTDSNAWLYLALWDTKYGYSIEAHTAIANAARYGNVQPELYNAIMNNETFGYSICNGAPIQI